MTPLELCVILTVQPAPSFLNTAIKLGRERLDPTTVSTSGAVPTPAASGSEYRQSHPFPLHLLHSTHFEHSAPSFLQESHSISLGHTHCAVVPLLMHAAQVFPWSHVLPHPGVLRQGMHIFLGRGAPRFETLGRTAGEGRAEFVEVRAGRGRFKLRLDFSGGASRIYLNSLWYAVLQGRQ